MSIKVAVASSDGKNIDLHFGQAKSFLIYEFKDGKFDFSEKREVPLPEEGSVAGESSTSDFSTSYGSASYGAGFGCGSGGGCGSGTGCGGGYGGGCGGGPSGPLSPAVTLLLDVRAVVAAQIGQNIRRQLEKNAVSVFDIELPLDEALKKLAAYYSKFGE